METAPAIRIGIAFVQFFLIALLLPLIPALLFGLSFPATLALMASGFIIEYGASPLGIGLKLPPVFVLFVLVCIAAGTMLLLFDLFRLIGDSSIRISRFLEKARIRAQGSRIISRYGIWGLIPCVWILGFYVCTPVAWVLGWNRTHAIAITLAGFIFAATITILASMGLFAVLFH